MLGDRLYIDKKNGRITPLKYIIDYMLELKSFYFIIMFSKEFLLTFFLIKT